MTCKLCTAGCPLQGNQHYGTQATGMNPLTPCDDAARPTIGQAVRWDGQNRGKFTKIHAVDSYTKKTACGCTIPTHANPQYMGKLDRSYAREACSKCFDI